LEEKENEVKVIEKRTRWISKYLKQFFSKENFPLLTVLILAIIIQLYFLIKTFNQPLWWDEAVYLLKSKAIAFGTPDYGVNRGRALLDSFIWAGLFKLGFTEHFFRILQSIFAVITVGLTYKLILSMTKNKLISFFSSFALAVCWVVTYVTTRFFPDLMGLFFWIVLMFLFWKGYVEKSEIVKKYFYLIGPVFVLASYAREMNLMFVGIIAVYMFAKEKFSLFKKKEVYILILIALISAIPFFIYYYHNFGNPLENWTYRFSSLKFNTPEAAAAEGVPFGTSTYFNFMPDYFGWGVIILLLIGIIYISKIFLGLDIILKNKKTNMDHLFLLFLWALIPFLYIIFQIKIYDERYILIIYPAVYTIGGYALYHISEYVSKHIGKIFAVILILIVLALVAYPHFNRAESLIDAKKDSYAQVEQAGLWIKDHSVPRDIIFGQSVPQLIYYSERLSLGFEENESDFIIDTQTKKPKYMVISIFEQHPQWVYSFPQKNANLLVPVQAYFINNNQPALVIYQFNYTNALSFNKTNN